jgi:hypothetical protein
MEAMGSIDDRLGRIEALLGVLVKQQTIKDWYCTAEVGELLDKSEYTVREWCRQGRVRASKRPVGGGDSRDLFLADTPTFRGALGEIDRLDRPPSAPSERWRETLKRSAKRRER